MAEGHGDYHGDRMNILHSILQERMAQLKKFGFQDIEFCYNLIDPVARCHVYSIPEERYAKLLVEDATKHHMLTSVHIILEELAEAVSAASPSETRHELVQLGASVLAAIERIDLQMERKAASIAEGEAAVAQVIAELSPE